MRRRLLLALLPLLFVLLVALEVPLAQTYADRRTQELFIESIGDARALGAGADETMRRLAGRRALAARVRDERTLRGRTITIVDEDGDRLLPEVTPPPKPATRQALEAALDRLDPARPPTAWPWRTQPMIVALPIGQDTTLTGAVAVEVATDDVRADVRRRIAILAALGLSLLLVVTVLGVLPVVRWVLRPVDELGASAARLAAGDLEVRASERSGPPELRGLAAAFNRMAASLATALERQRAFVADASHELRNPLAALRLRLDGLVGSLDGEDERRARLAIAESERLARTVTRLLELARAEATAAEREDFDLVALTLGRLDAWSPALEEAGIDLHVESPEPAWVRGSPDAAEYALDVLLDNACSYAPGAALDVAIAHRGDAVEVRVRDHGDVTESEHIGERFWRGSRHRSIPGTGLGVATARALLEGSGGSLRLDAARPGLAATIRLPVATARTSDSRRDAAGSETSRDPSAR
jgi:signal transduction histidine kinase